MNNIRDGPGFYTVLSEFINSSNPYSEEKYMAIGECSVEKMTKKEATWSISDAEMARLIEANGSIDEYFLVYPKHMAGGLSLTQ